MDYYAPADGSAFMLTAEKHSALLEVGGGVVECARQQFERPPLMGKARWYGRMHAVAPCQPPTLRAEFILSTHTTAALQALVGRNFAHHPNLVQASAQVQG